MCTGYLHVMRASGLYDKVALIIYNIVKAHFNVGSILLPW